MPGEVTVVIHKSCTAVWKEEDWPRLWFSHIHYTYGVQYQQVCGRVRGYQFRSPDAFHTTYSWSCTTDDSYVDGIGITHGCRPRKHIWTYAAGLTENSTYIFNCPCSGGRAPPNFVGSDYYCESGLNTGPWDYVLYSNDPLWDGQSCRGLEHTCCNPQGLPWFCKMLSQPTTDDLELRICADQNDPDEDTPIELVQIYIQWNMMILCEIIHNIILVAEWIVFLHGFYQI